MQRITVFRHIAVFILSIVLVYICPAQLPLSSVDSSAILKVFYQQQDAWNAADIDRFMEGYWRSEKLVFVGADGPTYGWEPVKANYYRRYPDPDAMGKLQFTVIEVSKIATSTAFLIGKFHLTRVIGDLEGFFTLVWSKINGSWLIVSDHTSAAN